MQHTRARVPCTGTMDTGVSRTPDVVIKRRFRYNRSRIAMLAPLTPLDFLARSARTWPNEIAVVSGDRRFTYAEFENRAARMAGALEAMGIGFGDRVAV